MRPPRLKLRTLIVLVTLATLAVGGVEYRRRVARYRALAAHELQREAFMRYEHKAVMNIAASCRQTHREFRESTLKSLAEYKQMWQEFMPTIDDPETLRRYFGREQRDADSHIDWSQAVSERHVLHNLGVAKRYERAASHHARRRAAFLRCARYPWLSPPADEPGPESR